MNKLYLISIIIITLSNSNAFAQNTIYKCVDANGNVSYVNKDKSEKCKSTSLGTLEKSSILNKNTKTNSLNNDSIGFSNSINVESSQVIRNKKRLLILKNEIDKEIEQKKLMESMLDKIPYHQRDDEESLRLKNLLNTYNKNIETLQKEIEITSKLIPSEFNNEYSTHKIPNNIPKNLPDFTKDKFGKNILIDPNVEIVNTPEEVNFLSKKEVKSKKNNESTEKEVKSKKNNESTEKEFFSPSLITNQSLNKNKLKDLNN